MRRIAIFLAATTICGAGVYYYSTNTVEARFIAACEEAVKGQLKSPSTYKQISYNYSYGPMKTDDYVSAVYKQAYDLDPKSKNYTSRRDYYYKQIEAARSGQTKPYEITARVEYDAANSYGAPIRNSFTCSYVQEQKNSGKLYPSFMKIDGLTNLDFAVKQLKN